MAQSLGLDTKSRTMRAFIEELRRNYACEPALRRARRFATPQAFWKALGANERVARRHSVYWPSSADWMCRLLRITERRDIGHWTPACRRCKSGPAVILRKFPRIGMKAGKIVAYPAKGTK